MNLTMCSGCRCWSTALCLLESSLNCRPVNSASKLLLLCWQFSDVSKLRVKGHRPGLICTSYFWSAVSHVINAQQQQLPSAWWLVSAVYNCATATSAAPIQSPLSLTVVRGLYRASTYKMLPSLHCLNHVMLYSSAVLPL